MRFYFAPMEGVTLYQLRQVHKEVFGKGVDEYFTPFLTASHTHHFKNREKRDVLVFEDRCIPQIMAGCSTDFIWASKELKSLGYTRVNLNLGCPAPTVVNRKKGAGLLIDPDYLERMLKEIFENGQDLPEISLKTRLGFSDPSESSRLMEIYASVPISELIIHARVKEDLYAGEPRISEFGRAVSVYREKGGEADICYNGDINSADDYFRMTAMPELKDISAVMMGRGLLYDPSLVRQIGSGDDKSAVNKLTAEELRTYLKRLYEAYEKIIPEDRNVIFKMLEHWAYLQIHFPGCERHLKNIRKSRSKGEYHAAVNNIFANCDFV